MYNKIVLFILIIVFMINQGVYCNEKSTSQEVKIIKEIKGNWNEEKEKASKISYQMMIVDIYGNILYKSSDYSFDENDFLIVYVIGKESKLKTLKIERTSKIRDPSKNTVLGGEGLQLKTKSTNILPIPETKLTYRKFIFDSFAPGEGIIQISENSKSIGSIKFKVNALYSGMFTLGAVRSDLTKNEYKIGNDGTNDIIIQSRGSDYEYLYSIFYTHFIWGKRDIEKEIKFYERFNPTIGIALDDKFENIFLGMSFDYNGIVLTGGWHVGKYDYISSDSGLKVGDTYSGSIPMSEKWDEQFFLSVSVDIRTMMKLFGFVDSN